jgi:hypothetical protein
MGKRNTYMVVVLAALKKRERRKRKEMKRRKDIGMAADPYEHMSYGQMVKIRQMVKVRHGCTSI